jgi:hypothetical protein
MSIIGVESPEMHLMQELPPRACPDGVTVSALEAAP